MFLALGDTEVSQRISRLDFGEFRDRTMGQRRKQNLAIKPKPVLVALRDPIPTSAGKNSHSDVQEEQREAAQGNTRLQKSRHVGLQELSGVVEIGTGGWQEREEGGMAKGEERIGKGDSDWDEYEEDVGDDWYGNVDRPHSIASDPSSESE